MPNLGDDADFDARHAPGQDEASTRFQHVADARFSKIVKSGRTISWSDMRRYLEARMTGKPTAE
jgi:hypothetical protein